MTWSIVAVDTGSGASGVAVASCVALDVLVRVPALVAGRGAIATQSYLLDGQRERGVALLEEGLEPTAVLAALLDPVFDPDFALRQIAVVDREGGVAAFTGEGALPFAAHVEVRDRGLVASIQGNILTGADVLDAAARAFTDPGACDLPERLLRALEEGGQDGRGDARCVGEGPSSQSALLRAGDLVIEVGLDAPGAGPDPIATVRAELETWRVAHPCAAAEGRGGAGGGGGASAAEPLEPAASELAPDTGCGIASTGGGGSAAVLGMVVALALARRHAPPLLALRLRRRREPHPAPPGPDAPTPRRRA